MSEHARYIDESKLNIDVEKLTPSNWLLHFQMLVDVLRDLAEQRVQAWYNRQNNLLARDRYLGYENCYSSRLNQIGIWFDKWQGMWDDVNKYPKRQSRTTIEKNLLYAIDRMDKTVDIARTFYLTLIEALGVPWLQLTPDHPHEAEGVCAALPQHGLADLVISEDTDVVVYGAPVLRNTTLADQPKVPMNVLDPVKLREYSLCSLGPVSALKAVRKYRSIENVLVAVSDRFRLNETFTAAYLATARTARDIFLNLPPLPHADPLPLAMSDRALAGDGVDPIAESTAYLGTLQPTEPSPILPLLLAKYGIPRASPSQEYDNSWDDVLDNDSDAGSTLVEEDESGFDWGDLDALEVNLVSGTGTVDDVVETGDFAEDLTLSDRDAVATTSAPPQVFSSLDTTFERLYL